MKTPVFTHATLGGGMPAVHVLAPAAATEMCGVFINAGSRNDPRHLPGMAHFVEHTIFKGTKHRRAWHINNRMESVGGEINAFTAKEETVVYAVGPYGCLRRATELVADLVSAPVFPERELSIERGVVCDEIDSYRDTPADAVYDDFEDALFAGTALGHNILGTAGSVEIIDAADCHNFVAANYVASNMVFFYVGRRSASPVFAAADKLLSSVPAGVRPAVASVGAPAAVFHTVERRELHQANTVLGRRIAGRHNPSRYALALLTNILGGPGMNSLLNMELRERRGLVYSVDAVMTAYSDCGMLTVAYGCDPHDDARCRAAVARVMRRMPDLLADRRVEAAKRQYVGQLIVGNDNREGVAIRAARSMACYGRVIDPEETRERIMTVTPEQLRALAAATFDPDTFSSHTIM